MKLELFTKYLFWIAASLALSGCGSLTVLQRNQVSGIVAGLVAGSTPTTELEQIYYLGVFDPQDQVPPMLYRVRVRGQSGALNQTQFASGWVPASVIDSLSGQVGIGLSGPEPGKVTVSPDNAPEPRASIYDYQKRLILFGPEGFRESPQNHRLVIVMGSSPDKFFNAVDDALGTVAAAKKPSTFKGLNFSVSNFLLQLKNDQEALADTVTK